jgi:acid phosphatase type 7
MAALGTTSSVARGQTFKATADATIKYKYASSNYGSSSKLESDRSPLEHALLKFSVSGISGSVTSVRIRLYVTDSSSSGPEIYRTGTAWNESTVTWNGQPSVISAALDDRGSISSGKYIEYDVTKVVNGDGEYSFLLKADSSDGASFASRESSRSPEMVIAANLASSPSPTPTPALS